jgi:hypothetical protein
MFPAKAYCIAALVTLSLNFGLKNEKTFQTIRPPFRKAGPGFRP